MPAPPGRGKGLRRAVMGIGTVLGLTRKGYFVPYRYAAALPAPGASPSYAFLEAAFAARRAAFESLIAEIDALAAELASIGSDAAPEPRWRQDWFPRLDGAAAYAMVRTRTPRRIVEIGSGHSTRFLARAVRDGRCATRLVAIDPAPRASLDGLGVETIARPLHEVGTEVFAELAAGDMVVVDSSHILMPGTDVDFLLNRVWPTLAAGVIVHFHDVFLPDDYPAAWGWRGYNEQLGIAPLIAAGGAEVLFASHYVATRMAGALAATAVARLPLVPGAVESSLWLETRGGETRVPAG